MSARNLKLPEGEKESTLAAQSIFRALYFFIFWSAPCENVFSFLYPVILNEKGASSFDIGLLMGMLQMIKIFAAPLVHITIVKFGLQLTLFVSCVLQAIGYFILIIVLKLNTLKTFLAATYCTLVLIGTSRMA